MFVVVGSAITFTVLLFVTCSPVSYNWGQYSVTYKPGYCTSKSSQALGGIMQGSWSVISDFYSVLLPAALLLRIRISRRQRWGLMFIFGLGFMWVFTWDAFRLNLSWFLSPGSSWLAVSELSILRELKVPQTNRGMCLTHTLLLLQKWMSRLFAPAHHRSSRSLASFSATSQANPIAKRALETMIRTILALHRLIQTLSHPRWIPQ